MNILRPQKKSMKTKSCRNYSNSTFLFFTVYSGITFNSCGKPFPTRPFEAVVLILFLITLVSNFIVIVCSVRHFRWICIYLCFWTPIFFFILLMTADYLIQSGLASQIRFHGKRIPWFVSDVTRKDWSWLLNTMVYGHLFPSASEVWKEENLCFASMHQLMWTPQQTDIESLRRMGQRWKQYEKDGIWTYEQHPFWCTGYTFVSHL